MRRQQDMDEDRMAPMTMGARGGKYLIIYALSYTPPYKPPYKLEHIGIIRQRKDRMAPLATMDTPRGRQAAVHTLVWVARSLCATCYAQQQKTVVSHQPSANKHPPSDIRHQPSAIRHQTSNICYCLMSATIGHPSADNRQRPTDIACRRQAPSGRAHRRSPRPSTAVRTRLAPGR